MSEPVTFEEYRTWLLNPNETAGPNPLNDQERRISPQTGAVSLLEYMDDHAWENETVMTDLAEYSQHRAQRILNHRFAAPPSLHRLNINQIYAAHDHSLPTPFSQNNTMQFEKLVRENLDLRPEYGEYLHRRPRDLTNMKDNLAWLINDSRTWNDGDVKNLRDHIQNAEAAAKRLFHRHLRFFLSPNEYEETKNLDPVILRQLYADIWDNGLERYQDAVIETRPVNFKNYFWNNQIGRWQHLHNPLVLVR